MTEETLEATPTTETSSDPQAAAESVVPLPETATVSQEEYDRLKAERDLSARPAGPVAGGI